MNISSFAPRELLLQQFLQRWKSLHYVIHEDAVAAGGNRCLFKSQLLNLVLHEYMGIATTCKDQRDKDGSSIWETMLFLAIFDDIIVVYVTNFREDFKDNIGVLRQKVYQEVFQPFLPEAFL